MGGKAYVPGGGGVNCGCRALCTVEAAESLSWAVVKEGRRRVRKTQQNRSSAVSILKMCAELDFGCHGQLACPCPPPRTGGQSRQWHTLPVCTESRWAMPTLRKKALIIFT